MTDKEKLDKIIAEIERRITFFKKQSVRKTTTDDNSCALALQGVLCFYDSIQKEPVKIKKGCKYRCLSDMQNTDTGAISFFKDKIYSAPEDDTLVSEEYGWLCDTSENSSNFELVEEPVSEGLEEEIERHLKECLDVKFPTTNIELIKKDVRYTAKHFVNWQMQQLMKNVVLETEVLRDSDGDGVETPYESWLTLANTEIPELPESLGLKEGDKVKIVIVKSE